MKVLVTGGTSSIGKRVIKTLLEKGHDIRVLTRQKNNLILPEKTDVWQFDLLEIPNEIGKDIDVVIHMASATPNTNNGPDSFHITNVEGTKRLLSVCELYPIKHFIYISSVMVLFDGPGDPYSKSKKDAECLICESNVNWTLLRPAEIIGADKSLYNMLSLLRKKKLVWVPGNGRQLRHPVFYRDVSDAIIQSILKPRTFGKKYSLAAKEPVSYFNYLTIFRKIYKLSFKIIVVPGWLLKILSAIPFLLPKKVRNKLHNATNMLRSFHFTIDEAKNDFGYNPADVEKAFLEVLKEEQ